MLPSSPLQYAPTLLTGTGCSCALIFFSFCNWFNSCGLIPLMPIFSKIVANSFHICGRVFSNSPSVILQSIGVERSERKFPVSCSLCGSFLTDGMTITSDLFSCSPVYWGSSFNSVSWLYWECCDPMSTYNEVKSKCRGGFSTSSSSNGAKSKVLLPCFAFLTWSHRFSG